MVSWSWSDAVEYLIKYLCRVGKKLKYLSRTANQITIHRTKANEKRATLATLMMDNYCNGIVLIMNVCLFISMGWKMQQICSILMTGKKLIFCSLYCKTHKSMQQCNNECQYCGKRLNYVLPPQLMGWFECN